MTDAQEQHNLVQHILQQQQQQQARQEFLQQQQHEQQQTQQLQNQQLLAALTQLAQAHVVQPLPPAPAPILVPSGAYRFPNKPPAEFSGRSGAALEEWLSVMRQQHDAHASVLSSDTERIRLGAFCLTGAALSWWQSLAAADRPSTWDAFVAGLRQQFQPVDAALDARDRLFSLKQGNRAVHELACEYRRLLSMLPPGSTSRSEQDKAYDFCARLRAPLRARIREREQQPETLQGMITLAARLEGSALHGSHVGSSSSNSSSGESMDCSAVEDGSDSSTTHATLLARLVQMQEQLSAFQTRRDRGYGPALPRYSLTPGVTAAQIEERKRNGWCFACGSKEHIKKDCLTVKASTAAPSSTQKKGNCYVPPGMEGTYPHIPPSCTQRAKLWNK